MLNVAKAHEVLAKPYAPKKERRRIEAAAIASMKGLSAIGNAANAHAVFHKSCGLNSGIVGIAADAIADSRG